jgi:hypothetical protein
LPGEENEELVRRRLGAGIGIGRQMRCPGTVRIGTSKRILPHWCPDGVAVV